MKQINWLLCHCWISLIWLCPPGWLCFCPSVLVCLSAGLHVHKSYGWTFMKNFWWALDRKQPKRFWM